MIGLRHVNKNGVRGLDMVLINQRERERECVPLQLRANRYNGLGKNEESRQKNEAHIMRRLFENTAEKKADSNLRLRHSTQSSILNDSLDWSNLNHNGEKFSAPAWGHS
jgi:hypothetical protein